MATQDDDDEDKEDEEVMARRLVPASPQFTLRRSVTFTNASPMELGVTYGAAFWELSLDLMRNAQCEIHQSAQGSWDVNCDATVAE